MEQNRWIILIEAVCIAAILAGCKPTEANYRSAYDAALSKRNQTDPDAALLYGNHKLASPLGATPDFVGSDTILSLYAPATLLHLSPEAEKNRYRTVIAHYRMEQNAVDHARRLSEEGFNGTGVAKLGEEKYLVIINSAPTKEDGVTFTIEYRRSHPDGPWIGLTPPEPILLITR